MHDEVFRLRGLLARSEADLAQAEAEAVAERTRRMVLEKGAKRSLAVDAAVRAALARKLVI